jgi:hypothetical protein
MTCIESTLIFSAGNPFIFMVNDPSRVVARGEGLNLIRCGQSAAFVVTAPGAQLKDLDIRVTGNKVRISSS